MIRNLTLQEALAMFPAKGEPLAMAADDRGEMAQVAGQILADAFRRLSQEQIELLRGICALSKQVTAGSEYCLVPAALIRQLDRKVADLYRR